MKTLDVAPMRTCARITGQNDRARATKEHADRKGDEPRRHEGSLRAETIDERARRRLRDDARDSADREREPHTLFVPPVPGEKDREKGSDARLHVGEEEIDQVEAAQTP